MGERNSRDHLERYRVKVVSERMLASLWTTYKTIASHKGIVYVNQLLDEIHVKKSQLYTHLQLLKFADFIEIRKFGRKSAVFIREYAGSKHEFERKFIESYSRKKDEDIYTVAFSIKEKMQEYDITGDLFGAVKIHEAVPEHSRITHDINLVVLREDAKKMELLLNSMDFVMITNQSVFPYSDVTYVVPGTTWQIFVLYDGIKHPRNPQIRFLDLSPVLREFKQIPLEYVVAAKLLRFPHLRKKEDSEDIIAALVSDVDVNIDRVIRIVGNVVRKYPEFKEVVYGNLDTVEWFLNEYEFNIHVIERMRRILERMRRDLSEELGEELSIRKVHV